MVEPFGGRDGWLRKETVSEEWLGRQVLQGFYMRETQFEISITHPGGGVKGQLDRKIWKSKVRLRPKVYIWESSAWTVFKVLELGRTSQEESMGNEEGLTLNSDILRQSKQERRWSISSLGTRNRECCVMWISGRAYFKIEVVISDVAGEVGIREVSEQWLINLTRTQKHGGDPHLSCQGRQKTNRYTNQILERVDR